MTELASVILSPGVYFCVNVPVTLLGKALSASFAIIWSSSQAQVCHGMCLEVALLRELPIADKTPEIIKVGQLANSWRGFVWSWLDDEHVNVTLNPLRRSAPLVSLPSALLRL